MLMKKRVDKLTNKLRKYNTYDGTLRVQDYFDKVDKVEEMTELSCLGQSNWGYP